MHQVKDGNLSVTIAETRKDDFQDIYDTFNDMTCRLEQLIQTVAEERTLNESAELRLLQEQLNPHFLYNTLDSIYSIAKIHKEDQIAEIVAAMSRFFRWSDLEQWKKYRYNGRGCGYCEKLSDYTKNPGLEIVSITVLKLKRGLQKFRYQNYFCSQ